MRASDIHIEAAESVIRVRYRIDGLLHDMEPPSIRLKNAIISRVKIMARLNIAERRLPQDGRIRMRSAAKRSIFRVSVIPTIHGESIALRVLDRDAVALDFDKLGFDTDQRATLARSDPLHQRYRPGDRAHEQRQDDHTLRVACSAE